MCSLNARSKRPNHASLLESIGASLEGEGSVAWLSSCSRNAHARKVLVRRAQPRINQATLLREPAYSLRGSGETSEFGRGRRERPGALLARRTRTMKLWSPGTRARPSALGVGRVRMSRAVEGGLGHSPLREVERIARSSVDARK